MDTKVLVETSQVKDGSMKFEWGERHEVVRNESAFLSKYGIEMEQTVNVYISGKTSWDVVRLVTNENGGEGMDEPSDRIPADALITNTPGLALFLQTADCYPTIVYDPTHAAIGLLHLGWQSTAAHLVRSALERMNLEFKTVPSECKVYFGPGIKKESYAFENPTQLSDPDWAPYLVKQPNGLWGIDLLGYNIHQFITAGALSTRITQSSLDTAKDPDYFSHFATEKLGRPGPAGRFATVAMLKK